MNQKGFSNIKAIALAVVFVGVGVVAYLTFTTPRELAKESNTVFEFQYPKGFSVSEDGYKTPGGFRFPSLSIKKDGGKEADAIYIPGGMSTGPEITCETQASPDDKCVEIQGYVIITKSKDKSVLKAFEIITSTFQAKSYGTYTDENDPVDSDSTDNYGIISGQVIDKEKQPISDVKIVVKARPVDIAPDGNFSLRSFDSGAVYIGEVITDQRGRFNISVPLGIANNPLKELNRLNMFIISANRTGYSETTNFMVKVTDGQTSRVDFELQVEQEPRG